MKMIELAADTDLGKQRKDNQDIFICKRCWSDDQGLIGVIDGVGGYEGGEVAAKIARECIEFYMSTPKGDALSMLKEAVVLANNQITEAKEKDPQLSQMCCVLTVAVADAKSQLLYYVHVGDTRLYRYRKGKLEKITRDHSLVGVREDAGVLTEEEAMQHPRRNVILRQVGTEAHRIDDDEFLEFGETEFLPGDLLLICSDGLSDMITREEMIDTFRKQLLFKSIVDDLINLANKAGGHDNITVVIARNRSRQKRLVQGETDLPSGSSMSVPDLKESEPSKKKTSRAFVGSVLAGALALSMAFWLYSKTGAEAQKPAGVINDTLAPLAILDSGLSRSPNNSSQAVSILPAVDSLSNFIQQHTGQELILEKTGRDTILVSHAIELGKITKLTGGQHKMIVLIPDAGAKTKSAVEVTGAEKNRIRKDTIVLKNLVIEGFETGIQVEGHIVLRLDNVIFKKVQQSVSYKAIDSVKSGYLTF